MSFPFHLAAASLPGSLPAAVDRLFPDLPAWLLSCAILFALFCLLGLLAVILRSGGLRRYFRRVSGSRPHRAAALGALGVLLFLAAAAALLSWTPAPTPLRLNEVCCANFSLCSDETGAFGDYIELVNTGDAPVDLAGYFLSDNPKKRNRFRLPARTLEPGELLLLWADDAGKSGADPGVDIHLNFSLKPGETVYLSSPRGTLLDQVPVPERYKDVSLSRLDGEWVLASGTPALDNRRGRLFTAPTLEPPRLSLASGFYAEPQSLKLTAAPGCEIRYTLDGSLPTRESLLYTAPLTLTDVSDQPNRVRSQPNTTPGRNRFVTEPVDKGNVLRVACFDGTGAFSETVSAVYFIGETLEKYRDKAVLSLVIDPEDLFGEKGIAVTGPDYDAWLEAGSEGSPPLANYQQHGRSWERGAELLLWDETGATVLDQSCGVRVQGNASRASGVKRFSLYARPVYAGSGVFGAQVFEGVDSHSLSTRNDLYDFMAQLLLRGRDLGTLDARPVTVFVNGEFYVETYLRERYDARYFEIHYGVDPADLVLISDNELDLGRSRDYEDYLELMHRIETGDCADPALWAEIQERIDLQSLLDFLAANFYCNNIDWRYEKNYKLWRSRSGGGEGALDGRWRWLAYDMDAVGWAKDKLDEPPASIDPFHTLLPWLDGKDNTLSYLDLPLFRSLLQNPEFKTRFLQTYLELMNLSFDAERAAPLLEQYGLTDHWLWTSFLTDRPAYAVRNLVEALELPGERCALTLTVSAPAGGTVKLGGEVPLFTEGRWEGTWVTGVPLELTAVPAEGWRFVRWEGGASGTQATLTVEPAGDAELIALFEPIQ